MDGARICWQLYGSALVDGSARSGKMTGSSEFRKVLQLVSVVSRSPLLCFTLLTSNGVVHTFPFLAPRLEVEGCEIHDSSGESEQLF